MIRSVSPFVRQESTVIKKRNSNIKSVTNTDYNTKSKLSIDGPFKSQVQPWMLNVKDVFSVSNQVGSDTPQELLFRAVLDNDIGFVRRALQLGASPVKPFDFDSFSLRDSRIKKGDTPMHLAARDGSLDILKVFYKSNQTKYMVKMHPNRVNGANMTYFQEAVANGHHVVVDFFLTNRGSISVDINTQDKDGMSSLLNALAAKQYFLAERILAEPDIDVKLVNDDNNNALHYAAEDLQLALMKRILCKDLSRSVVVMRNNSGDRAVDIVVKNFLMYTSQKGEVRVPIIANSKMVTDYQLAIEMLMENEVAYMNKVDPLLNVLSYFIDINKPKESKDLIILTTDYKQDVKIVDANDKFHISKEELNSAYHSFFKPKKNLYPDECKILKAIIENDELYEKLSLIRCEGDHNDRDDLVWLGFDGKFQWPLGGFTYIPSFADFWGIILKHDNAGNDIYDKISDFYKAYSSAIGEEYKESPFFDGKITVDVDGKAISPEKNYAGYVTKGSYALSNLSLGGDSINSIVNRRNEFLTFNETYIEKSIYPALRIQAIMKGDKSTVVSDILNELYVTMKRKTRDIVELNGQKIHVFSTSKDFYKAFNKQPVSQKCLKDGVDVYIGESTPEEFLTLMYFALHKLGFVSLSEFYSYSQPQNKDGKSEKKEDRIDVLLTALNDFEDTFRLDTTKRNHGLDYALKKKNLFSLINAIKLSE